MSRARLALVALAGVTVLLGCGEAAGTGEDAAPGGASTSAPPDRSPTIAPSGAEALPYNETDVFFAQQMIPHHEQALVIAQLAVGAGASLDIRALAYRIEAAQGPPINLLRLWLIEWGEDAPSETEGTDHGSMGHERMPGMMTDDELAALETTRGAEFDRMFLTAMIAHHNGAVLMARVELADGEHAGALELASQMEVDQLAEIAKMEELLS